MGALNEAVRVKAVHHLGAGKGPADLVAPDSFCTTVPFWHSYFIRWHFAIHREGCRGTPRGVIDVTLIALFCTFARFFYMRPSDPIRF